MFKAVLLLIIIIAITIGIAVWEFHYLIDIAHAPNWAVFIFVLLAIHIGLTSGRSNRDRG